MAVSLVTGAASGIGEVGANCSTTISGAAGFLIKRGVCWGTTSTPQPILGYGYTDDGTGDGYGNGTFTSAMTGLTPGTLYYYRAYLTSSSGGAPTTVFGAVRSFTTLKPTVTTAALSGITIIGATSGGTVTANGTTVTERGVCWGTSASPTIALATKTSDGSGAGTFSSAITGLAESTTYYVRAYATTASQTVYGSQLSFTTPTMVVPTVTASAVTDILPTSASGGGTVTSEGYESVDARGVCWNTTGSPTVANPHTTDGSGPGAFTSALTGLAQGTTYYVRAYATNYKGTGYSSQASFTTPAVGPPTVTIASTYATGADTATSGGNCTAENFGGAVMSKGVCWSTSPSPIKTGLHTSNGSGLGEFTSALTGLAGGTTYYVRAYATGLTGLTGYSSQASFTTPTPAYPSVQTSPISLITGTTAQSGGVVTSEGTMSVTARGVCRSTDHNPTTGNASTSDGSGLGEFVSTLSGLTSGVTYYVRAYATNAVGTGYGQEYSFKACDPPTVLTAVVHDIRAVSAASGGDVTSDGNSPITTRGVCYGTSAAPTTAGAHTSDGIGTGEYDSVITGLATSTLYHVRAFATNSQGTTYGNETTFTTLAQSVSTAPVTGVTETGAAGGGEVTGAIPAVVTRGVCWNLVGSPTVANWKTVNGSGAGAFVSTLSGLNPETTYYVRAYAALTGGAVIYGEEVAFPTTPHLRCSLGRNTAWMRALTAAEVATDSEAGMEYFGRSLAKGTVVLRGLVRTRKGTLMPAHHVRAGYWIQNVEWSPDPSQPAPPLYITGHSMSLGEQKNALTIGVDWMEREIGVRMGELLAIPATGAAGAAAAHEYVPDVATPSDPREPWAPEPYTAPWTPGAYEVPEDVGWASPDERNVQAPYIPEPPPPAPDYQAPDAVMPEPLIDTKGGGGTTVPDGTGDAGGGTGTGDGTTPPAKSWSPGNPWAGVVGSSTGLDSSAYYTNLAEDWEHENAIAQHLAEELALENMGGFS